MLQDLLQHVLLNGEAEPWDIKATVQRAFLFFSLAVVA